MQKTIAFHNYTIEMKSAKLQNNVGQYFNICINFTRANVLKIN